MKTYAVGDIHGAYKVLIQCFKRARFDYERDRLIVIGDVCDGHLWLTIKNKLFVHAGFNPDLPLEKNDPYFLVWDRDLLDRAWKKHLSGQEEQIGKYEDIFIGHTATVVY
ncbi:MAG: metallophosphoesterase, partial [Candidatus Omnitrophica bacterium]|nr:metallophosphoesterase [Candidatus Omnitrophota bacterium]